MVEIRQKYEDELCKMYESTYESNCNYESCSRGMCIAAQNIKFDYATKIGEHYGVDRVPKVLVVGKESIVAHTTIEQPVDNIFDAPNSHYRGTLYTLALVLTESFPRSTAIQDLKDYNYLLKQFCLTNYFKCAFRQGDSVRDIPVNNYMENSCYKLLMREIEILKPDIVIVQGKFTSKPFWNALEQGGSECIYGADSPISLYRYSVNGHSLCVLWGYHPASSRWHTNLDELKKAIARFKVYQGINYESV